MGENEDAVNEEELTLCCAACCANCSTGPNCGCSGKVGLCCEFKKLDTHQNSDESIFSIYLLLDLLSLVVTTYCQPFSCHFVPDTYLLIYFICSITLYFRSEP